MASKKIAARSTARAAEGITQRVLVDSFMSDFTTLLSAHGGVVHLPSVKNFATALAQRAANHTAVAYRKVAGNGE